MTENQTLAILMICMVIMSLGIAGVDRWNDRLRTENKRLRDWLAEMERNDPLTLDELREMKGEPVYTTRNGWRICYGVTDFTGELYMETGVGSRIPLCDYGKTWLAYRRPPKEN